MPTNLPPAIVADSASATKLFFDTYGMPNVQFAAGDIDATIAFFTSKGFDSDASSVTAATLLKQARVDGIPIFQLLDTLKNFNGLQLSALVGEILNNNRVPTSTLGYRVSVSPLTKIRNVIS
jgi:hypothetical protein